MKKIYDAPQNIRFGFACNSSSSHCFLLFDPKQHKTLPGRDNDGLEFGWNFFTADDKESKLGYMAIVLQESLKAFYPESEKQKVEEIFNLSVSSEYNNKERGDKEYGYIDHQSIIMLPITKDKQIDLQFFNEMLEFVLQDNVAILGGNDNTEEEHPAKECGTPFKWRQLDYENYSFQNVSRKDPITGMWTIFNKWNGSKFRFKFDKNVTENLQIKKAGLPELVDVKVTDECNFGCTFCYQGSTPSGKGADFNYLVKLVDAFDKASVFEVAIGGGEPLEYPKIYEFINLLESKGIIPNLTTRRLDLLLTEAKFYERLEKEGKQIKPVPGWSREKIDKVSEIRSRVNSEDNLERLLAVNSLGAIALSIDNLEDFEKNKEAIKTFKKILGSKPGINIQLIDGVVPAKDMRIILRWAKENYIGITLLGYKSDYRGSDFIPEHKGAWRTYLKDEKNFLANWDIKVDTAFCREYQDDLRQYTTKSWHTEEGGWSCYVDAVAQTIAPSSYGKESIEATSSLEDPSEFVSKFREIPVVK